MGLNLPDDLESLTRGVTRVRILQSGVIGDRALDEVVLREFECEDAGRLLELLAVTQPRRPFRCGCIGDHAIELWDGEELRATVGLHHGRSIRVAGWWSDALLYNGEALLRFLADHGVEGPLREMLKVREAEERAAATRRERLKAAPEAIRPIQPGLEGQRASDTAFAPTLGGVVACGEHLVVLDGDRLIRADPGETRGVVLQILPSASAELAADGGRAVIVAMVDRGEVWRVPVDGGAADVIARGQERPTSPTALDGRAAWLEQPWPTGYRTTTRVRLEGREEPIHEHKGGAWDLVVCGGSLLWARHGNPLWSVLHGKNIRRADLVRWDPGTGRAEVMAALEGGDDGSSVPRLFTDGDVIAWTSGQRIGVLEPVTDASRWVEVGAEIQCVRPLGADLLVAIAREDEGELIRLDPGGGRRMLARWNRAPVERERLAVIGDQAVWNAGERLWAVAISPGGET